MPEYVARAPDVDLPLSDFGPPSTRGPGDGGSLRYDPMVASGSRAVSPVELAPSPRARFQQQQHQTMQPSSSSFPVSSSSSSSSFSSPSPSATSPVHGGYYARGGYNAVGGGGGARNIVVGSNYAAGNPAQQQYQYQRSVSPFAGGNPRSYAVISGADGGAGGGGGPVLVAPSGQRVIYVPSGANGALAMPEATRQAQYASATAASRYHQPTTSPTRVVGYPSGYTGSGGSAANYARHYQPMTAATTTTTSAAAAVPATTGTAPTVATGQPATTAGGFYQPSYHTTVPSSTSTSSPSLGLVRPGRTLAPFEGFGGSGGSTDRKGRLEFVGRREIEFPIDAAGSKAAAKREKRDKEKEKEKRRREKEKKEKEKEKRKRKKEKERRKKKKEEEKKRRERERRKSGHRKGRSASASSGSYSDGTSTTSTYSYGSYDSSRRTGRRGNRSSRSVRSARRRPAARDDDRSRDYYGGERSDSSWRYSRSPRRERRRNQGASSSSGVAASATKARSIPIEEHDMGRESIADAEPSPALPPPPPPQESPPRARSGTQSVAKPPVKAPDATTASSSSSSSSSSGYGNGYGNGTGNGSGSVQQPTAVVSSPSPAAVGDAQPSHVQSQSRQQQPQFVATPEHLAYGIDMFNRDAKAGVTYLQQCRILDHPLSAESMANFFRTNRGISRAAMGVYLGKPGDINQATLKKFVEGFNFTGKQVDDALREFLNAFRLPGEGQMVERFMDAFAARYVITAPDGLFANADVVSVLAYAIVMLNTSLYNPQVKKKDKMKLQSFQAITRGINDGANLPAELVESIYNNISKAEIKMQSGEYT